MCFLFQVPTLDITSLQGYGTTFFDLFNQSLNAFKKDGEEVLIDSYEAYG